MNYRTDNTHKNHDLFQNDANKYKFNEITIIYKIQKNEDSVKLFGEDFIKNNINNCYWLIDCLKIKICEKYTLNLEQRNKDILEIKLIETNKIINMNNMFYWCTSLKSLPDISKRESNTNLFKFGMLYNCDRKIIPEKFKE